MNQNKSLWRNVAYKEHLALHSTNNNIYNGGNPFDETNDEIL